MKQNLRFGLVQNLLFFCFFKTSFSCIYLILRKEVLNIQFLGQEINVGPGKFGIKGLEKNSKLISN